jgi:hypothetical protein
VPERESVEVELSQEDRSLILRYGYPFERIEGALKALESSSTVETVALDCLELRRLLGDLSRSIKEADDENLRVKLDELCWRLELFQRGGHTVI